MCWCRAAGAALHSSRSRARLRMRYFRTVPLCIPCDECYNSRAVLFNPLSVLYVCLWLCVWPVRHDGQRKPRHGKPRVKNPRAQGSCVNPPALRGESGGGRREILPAARPQEPAHRTPPESESRGSPPGSPSSNYQVPTTQQGTSNPNRTPQRPTNSPFRQTPLSGGGAKRKEKRTEMMGLCQAG